MKICLVAIALWVAGAWANPPTKLNTVPDGQPLPNSAPEDRGLATNQIQYGLAMGRAYRCVGIQAEDVLNYGCFCGEGNTGIDTAPTDAVDNFCRTHDVNLWAISENPVYNNPGAAPCNCYTEILPFSCQDGKLVADSGLSACQAACESDLFTMAEQTAHAWTREYHRAFQHRWQPFSQALTLPAFCQTKAENLPYSPFAPPEGVTVPQYARWPIGHR